MGFLLSVQPFCSLRFVEVIIPLLYPLYNKKTSLVRMVDKRGFFDVKERQNDTYPIERAPKCYVLHLNKREFAVPFIPPRKRRIRG